MANTLTKIDIINHARYIANIQSVSHLGQDGEPDETYYEFQRVKLLNSKKFDFAKRVVNLSSLSSDAEGFYTLPADFLSAVYPTISERVGNKARFYTPPTAGAGYCPNLVRGSDSGRLMYVSNIVNTELFEIGFVDALVEGIAMRYAKQKADVARYQLLDKEYREQFKAYASAEGANTPPRIIHR